MLISIVFAALSSFMQLVGSTPTEDAGSVVAHPDSSTEPGTNNGSAGLIVHLYVIAGVFIAVNGLLYALTPPLI